MPADTQPPPSKAPVQPGQTLAGKYQVERVLGVGGMGVVVAARHMQLGQDVALKFLHDEVCAPDAVDRFMREARAAVQIQSEHVARVIDVGQLETGSPYIVMEYLQGTDLAAVLQSSGPLPVSEAVDYLLQAAEAIAVAHRLRIVHRDLKPANLFLTYRPDETSLVKVLDFGISKSLDATGGFGGLSMTSTVNVMGSPLYMSPEQVRSPKSVDTRTDLWSLGVILHELVTGRYPFSAETVPELWSLVLMEPPTPLRAHRPDAPELLETVILRCLEKDVGARFQHVSELAEALAPLAPPSAQLCVDRIRRVMRGSMPPPGQIQKTMPSRTDTPTPPPPAVHVQGARRSSAPPPPSAVPHFTMPFAHGHAQTPVPPGASTPTPTPSPLTSTTGDRLGMAGAGTGSRSWSGAPPPAKSSATKAIVIASAAASLCILLGIGVTLQWLVGRRSSGGPPAVDSAASSSAAASASSLPPPQNPSASSIAIASASASPSESPEPDPPSSATVATAAASATVVPVVSAVASAPRPGLTAAKASASAKPKGPGGDGFSDRK